MQRNERIDEFIENWLDFGLKLREKKGIDKVLLEKIMDSLKEIKKDYAESSSIPKELAGTFIDLYIVHFVTCDLYPEEHRSLIIAIGDQIVDLARDICH